MFVSCTFNKTMPVGLQAPEGVQAPVGLQAPEGVQAPLQKHPC
jgi:hypothetical protein